MPSVQSTDWWQTFFNLGGTAGALSLIWQIVRETRNHSRRPRLRCPEFSQERDIFNFVRDPDDHRRFVTLQVENYGRRAARGCIARASITSQGRGPSSRGVALHWADIPVTHSTTGEFPVDIPAGGKHRLDVAFCTSVRPGCWLATMSAMYGNYFGDAELKQGEHQVEVGLTFGDGQDYRCRLRLVSPGDWRELNAAAL